jgi:uncharacterized membrane protein YcaP (DUF421 family)
MGKRQISELQTSELVVTLLISDIASIPMQNSAQPLFSGLIPIVVLVCCEIFISHFMVKNSKFRKLICGSAVIIISEGKILQKELEKLRMSVDELYEQLHEMDIFSVKDVAFAIIETNGKMSVLKKSERQTPDSSSLGIDTPENVLEFVVISNGEINNLSLSSCGLSKNWIDEILSKKKLNVSDVYIMTANKNKEFNVIKKEKT